jgi:hypothetical protein
MNPRKVGEALIRLGRENEELQTRVRFLEAVLGEVRGLADEYADASTSGLRGDLYDVLDRVALSGQAPAPTRDDLADIVGLLAACEPRPTADDVWCYFCGGDVNEPDVEAGHGDGCLWLRARAALSAVPAQPATSRRVTVAEMGGAFEGGPDSVEWLREQREAQPATEPEPCRCRPGRLQPCAACMAKINEGSRRE